MLSCECGEWDGEPGTWAYDPPNDFSKLETKRARRCSSCNELIKVGADCLKFSRVRSAYTEIEERICGEEINMAPLFMCERCGEIYLNLEDAGYCLFPDEEMTEALEEYWELTGFTPIKMFE